MKTHCKRGHQRTFENVRQNGHCRECENTALCANPTRNARARVCRNEHIVAYRALNNDWNKRNRVHRAAYARERRKTDVNFALAASLRSRLRQAMKGKGRRVGSAVRDLGCTVAFFKMYLSLLFRPGMTWENRSEWHIDHIVPLASFDLTERVQFLNAVHYTNLQPLWAAENLQKNARIMSIFR